MDTSHNMSKPIITFVILLLVTARTPPTAAKSWEGITPLRSTADDAAKLSSSCKETETRCQFNLDDNEVMIIFSGSKIGVMECERVPERTVLAIIIKFSHPKNLPEFKLKNKRYKTFDPSSPPKEGYKTYYDKQDGFMINTFKGQVIGLVYLATKKDIHLCPEYYEDPKAFVALGLIQ